MIIRKVGKTEGRRAAREGGGGVQTGPEGGKE